MRAAAKPRMRNAATYATAQVVAFAVPHLLLSDRVMEVVIAALLLSAFTFGIAFGWFPLFPKFKSRVRAWHILFATFTLASLANEMVRVP